MLGKNDVYLCRSTFVFSSPSFSSILSLSLSLSPCSLVWSDQLNIHVQFENWIQLKLFSSIEISIFNWRGWGRLFVNVENWKLKFQLNLTFKSDTTGIAQYTSDNDPHPQDSILIAHFSIYYCQMLK